MSNVLDDLSQYEGKDPNYRLVVIYVTGGRESLPYHTDSQVALVEDSGILRLDTLEGSFFFVLANVLGWSLLENFPEKVGDRIRDEAGTGLIKIEGGAV